MLLIGLAGEMISSSQTEGLLLVDVKTLRKQELTESAGLKLVQHVHHLAKEMKSFL